MKSAWEIVQEELRMADIFLILLVMASIGYSSWTVMHHRQKSRVYIYKDNVLRGVYELEKPQEVTIDEHNRVEIKNNQVRMSYADCHGQQCVKQGFSSSFPIICLPNSVTVEIVDDPQNRKLILH